MNTRKGKRDGYDWKQRTKNKTIKRSLLEWAAFFMILLALWSLAALAADNALICPTPWQTAEEMLVQAQSPAFVSTLAMTIGRALLSLAVSFVSALVCAMLAAFFRLVRGFLNRLVSLMQTIPNVCYIILLLFWTTRAQTVILTGFFLLFPLIYRTMYEELMALCETYRDVWLIYPQPVFVKMFTICLPMLRPAFFSALKSASSMAFKVCVMSEILTGITPGIGRSMQTARLALNPAGVIGWSLWLILIVFAFEALFSLLLEQLFRR